MKQPLPPSTQCIVNLWNFLPRGARATKMFSFKQPFNQFMADKALNGYPACLSASLGQGLGITSEESAAVLKSCLPASGWPRGEQRDGLGGSLI